MALLAHAHSATSFSVGVVPSGSSGSAPPPWPGRGERHPMFLDCAIGARQE